MKAQAIPTIEAAEAPPFPRAGERGSFIGAMAIFLLSMACFLPLLGSAPLAGTEGHRVFPSLEMVRSGDWLLPRLYGQLYLIKPPLHDWLIAVAQILSGNRGDAFVWRLPSAIVGALLNACLYRFGARWFGRIGGIVSGLSGLGLLCLWGQARSADVDATNTLACSLAAFCLIELYFGGPKRRSLWIVGAGLALGATLLTKGPAGLPLIMGVILWAFWSQRKTPAKPLFLSSCGLWGPLIIGGGIFVTYAIAAKVALNRLHLTPDLSGAAEVGDKIFPRTIGQFLWAVCVPFEAFAYTLPVSLTLILSFVPEFRAAIAASQQEGGAPRLELTGAMTASVLISWVICTATGMVNPRYAYVTVAPLCLLAGALAASVPWQIAEAQSVFRRLVLGSVVLLFGGSVALTVLAWHGGIGHRAMIASLCVALIIMAMTFRGLATRPDFRAAWGMVFLLVLAAIPFSYQFRLDRFDRSGYGESQALRDYVGGPDAPILTGAVLHSIPELFWYAGLHPHMTRTFVLQNPRQYPGGTWVVLDPEKEYRRWSVFAPRRLSRIRTFVIHKDKVVVAWFSAEDPPAVAAQPSTRPR